MVCVRGRLLLGGYILAIEQVGIYAESANLPTIAVFSSGACCIIFSVLWYLPFIARVTRDSSMEGVHKAERITCQESNLKFGWIWPMWRPCRPCQEIIICLVKTIAHVKVRLTKT